LNFSLPFRQAALKFCLPWASFSRLFLNLVGRQLAWALAHWPSDNKKLIAQQGNLLVPDERMALLSNPEQWTLMVLYPKSNLHWSGYGYFMEPANEFYHYHFYSTGL